MSTKNGMISKCGFKTSHDVNVTKLFTIRHRPCLVAISDYNPTSRRAEKINSSHLIYECAPHGPHHMNNLVRDTTIAPRIVATGKQYIM